MLGAPRPSTFNDGQRQFYGLALIGAGVAFGAFGTLLTSVIIWGPWTAKSETLRLYEVGGALASYFLGSIAVIISLSIGGPVGRYKVHADRDGFDLEAEGHGDATHDDEQQEFAPPPSASPTNGAEGPHVP